MGEVGEQFGVGGATPAALFACLWTASAEVLGDAATAVLVKRAVARAAPGCPSLEGVAIERLGLGYRYRLPTVWSAPRGPGGAALRALVAELGPLVAELTGPVVLRRLAADPALRAAGLVTDEDAERWLGRA